ncbi:DNA polymerase III subunit delta [Limibacter armeniacum]|uniref:DNA polymerase III subunit n=1 Tax=Limibacter armeniacum TaxID=466084 RepID=UPI002FE583D7
MKFSQIPGLEETKKVLIKSVHDGHIAHAQLFLGQEGSANLALALAYATFINCTDKKSDDACGQCDSCRKFDKLVHPDLHFVFPTASAKGITKRSEAISDRFLPEWREFLQQHPYSGLYDWTSFFGAENKQAMIPKEESRSIVKALSMKAFEAEYKVMLIWLPELMQAPAANAILKILEEPPSKTLFLLVSNDANGLLTTILSRTQIVKVRNFRDEEIAQYLQEERDVDPVRAQQVAYLSNGSMLEALHNYDEVADESEKFFKLWMRACFKLDLTDLIINLTENFNKLGKEAQKKLFLYALNIFRESMMWKFTGEQVSRLGGEQKTFVENFSKVLHDRNLPNLVNLFNEAHYHIERNANPKITFLYLSIETARAFRQ